MKTKDTIRIIGSGIDAEHPAEWSDITKMCVRYVERRSKANKLRKAEDESYDPHPVAIRIAGRR